MFDKPENFKQDLESYQGLIFKDIEGVPELFSEPVTADNMQAKQEEAKRLLLLIQSHIDELNELQNKHPDMKEIVEREGYIENYLQNTNGTALPQLAAGFQQNQQLLVETQKNVFRENIVTESKGWIGAMPEIVGINQQHQSNIEKFINAQSVEEANRIISEVNGNDEENTANNSGEQEPNNVISLGGNDYQYYAAPLSTTTPNELDAAAEKISGSPVSSEKNKVNTELAQMYERINSDVKKLNDFANQFSTAVEKAHALVMNYYEEKNEDEDRLDDEYDEYFEDTKAFLNNVDGFKRQSEKCVGRLINDVNEALKTGDLNQVQNVVSSKKEELKELGALLKGLNKDERENERPLYLKAINEELKVFYKALDNIQSDVNAAKIMRAGDSLGGVSDPAKAIANAEAAVKNVAGITFDPRVSEVAGPFATLKEIKDTPTEEQGAKLNTDLAKVEKTQRETPDILKPNFKSSNASDMIAWAIEEFIRNLIELIKALIRLFLAAKDTISEKIGARTEQPSATMQITKGPRPELGTKQPDPQPQAQPVATADPTLTPSTPSHQGSLKSTEEEQPAVASTNPEESATPVASVVLGDGHATETGTVVKPVVAAHAVNVSEQPKPAEQLGVEEEQQKTPTLGDTTVAGDEVKAAQDLEKAAAVDEELEGGSNKRGVGSP